ncbi:hypothetical protein PR729_19120 [Providencia rettgeri]|nr:hypothetical protein PR729_26165 [Providencia rettgeri]OBY35611.1 hypothetical protein PR729_19120 [Providencia rettgeri]
MISFNKLESMNEAIKKKNLGFIYNYMEDRDNGILYPFSSFMMKYANKAGLDFCITTDINHRSGIIHDDKLIFMSYGTFDRLCKLANLMVKSGVLTGKKKDIEYYNLHLIDNPYVGFNNNEHDENLSDSELNLFLFLLHGFLVFIISHEIGHYVNKHGLRMKNNKADNVFDDITGHKYIKREELIASHARELVADNYALNKLKIHVKSAFHNEFFDFNHFLEWFKEDESDIFLSMLLITCYFKLSDGSNPCEHFNSTHPSTAARVHFIYACHMEILDNDVKMNKFSLLIKKVMLITNLIFSNTENTTELSWLEETSSPAMLDWFNEIYKEYPNWKC